ncbi:MAG: DUF1622 domain-containing protein [Candidatus Omnitrophota bacterium]
MQIVDAISLGIGSFGVIVIVWGSLISAIDLCSVELKRFLGDNSFAGRTLIRPSLQELAVLGSMVAIRTVISFFLNKEIGKSSKDS